MVDLARRVAAGQRRLVAPLPVPGAAGRAIAAGALLPGDAARLSRTTFEQWLALNPQFELTDRGRRSITELT